MTIAEHLTPEAEIKGAPALVCGRVNKSDIGVMIEGKGILLAADFQHFDPVSRKNTGLIFNYYAAPQDRHLISEPPKVMRFAGEIVSISEMKDICGHDGLMAPSARHLTDAAKFAPAELSLWHMPTPNLVTEMFNNKDKRDFAGTFAEAGMLGRPTKYWALSEKFDAQSLKAVIDFETGRRLAAHADSLAFSCRPVRAEIALRK